VTDFECLNAEVLKAHEAGDNATLVRVYNELGNTELAEGRELEGAFLLTQAYVYALEADLPEAEEIHAALAALGREE
jgi:hypothetical protein